MIYQQIINWCLYAAAFLVPLFFLPWTLDPLEINKQTLLILLILIALTIKTVETLAKGTITLRCNWINLLLIALLFTLGISSFLSDSGWLSWIGASRQEYTSFISFVAFVVLLWLISGQAKETAFFFKIIMMAVGGSIITGLLGLASVFGFFLPFGFAQSQAFNPVGTPNALGVFLAVSTVLINGLFLIRLDKQKTVPVLAIISSVLAFIYLAVINYWVLWMILIIGAAVLLFQVLLRAHQLHHTKKYLLTMLLLVGALFFLLTRASLKIPVPAEISPSASTSISIAKQVLVGTNFWFGSGPGTYLFDYARYRPVEVNQTNFWNTRFDRASSGLLTALPTLGIVPNLFMLSLGIVLAIIAFLQFFKQKEKQWFAFAILPAWLALVASFFFYPSNLALSFLFFLLSGLIYTLSEDKGKTIHLMKSKQKISAHFGFAFVSIILVAAVFTTCQRWYAEYLFTQAVRVERSGADLQTVARQIDQAAGLNRFNDNYYRNLAGVLLLEAKNQAAKIETDQTTPEQTKYLAAVMAASVNAAKKAADLEPKNVTNWLELGLVYRTFISNLEEADGFAISAYQKAIELEPNNPLNYLELGKTHLAIAATLEPAAASSAFAAAEENFQKATNLKSDYAPAHYQLALAYEKQGRIDEAIGKMESIVNYNPQDIGASFELGILYLRRLGERDLARAEKILKYTTELLPSYSNAHWYLAFVYEQEGKTAEAILEVEKVLELNPKNEMVKARLEQLRAGGMAEATVEPIE